MSDFATIDDITTLKRELTVDEQKRAEALIHIVSNLIREEADREGKDIDKMIEDGKPSADTVKAVVVDIVLRELNSPTSDEAVTQISQSALGYSTSYTPLSAGGGIWIKRAEWHKLWLHLQKVRSVELI